MLLLLLCALREALQGLRPILFLQTFFRSFSFRKPDWICEESAQDELGPCCLCVQVFPQQATPTATYFLIHSPIRGHSCLGLFWPAFPWSPSWWSRNVPESQIPPQKPQYYVGLSRLTCSVTEQSVSPQGPTYL